MSPATAIKSSKSSALKVIGGAVGALVLVLVAQAIQTPRVVDLLTPGSGLDLTVDYLSANEVDVQTLPETAVPDPLTTETLVRAVVADGVPVHRGLAQITLTNNAVAPVRITDIHIDASVLAAPLPGPLVVIFPQGGGPEENLTLYASLDHPKASVRSTTDGIPTKKSYFRGNSLAIDGSGATGMINLLVQADTVSGQFAVEVEYVLNGEARTVRQDVGAVTAPLCDSEGRLAYARMLTMDSSQVVGTSSPAGLDERFRQYEMKQETFGC